jgi:hypothetical protein
MGLMTRIRFQQGKDFPLLHSIQTDSGAHPASYPMGIGGVFPWGVKQPDEKLTNHFHLVRKSRMIELYLLSPICLHITVFY